MDNANYVFPKLVGECFRFPKAILLDDISGVGLVVYACLAHSKIRNSSYHLTYDSALKRYNLSGYQYKAGLDELRRKGIIRIEKKRFKTCNGYYERNFIYMLMYNNVASYFVVPVSFLKCRDLTIREKAFVLAFSQFAKSKYKDEASGLSLSRQFRIIGSRYGFSQSSCKRYIKNVRIIRKFITNEYVIDFSLL